MSEDEFRTQYAIASALVKTWPTWKQNILSISESGTLAVPRQPVDNSDPYRTIRPQLPKGSDV